MGPQPLSKVRPNILDSEIALDRTSVEVAEPSLLALGARQVATWSKLEITRTQMLALFLDWDFERVYAMFGELTGGRQRKDVIEAAVLSACDSNRQDPRFLMFARTFRALEPVEKRRNEFAHWLWGVSPVLPDALLLAEPSMIARFYAASLADIADNMAAQEKQPDRPAPQLSPRTRGKNYDTNRIWVYTAPVLEHEVCRVLDCDQLLQLLSHLMKAFEQDAEGCSELDYRINKLQSSQPLSRRHFKRR